MEPSAWEAVSPSSSPRGGLAGLKACLSHGATPVKWTGHASQVLPLSQLADVQASAPRRSPSADSRARAPEPWLLCEVGPGGARGRTVGLARVSAQNSSGRSRDLDSLYAFYPTLTLKSTPWGPGSFRLWR